MWALQTILISIFLCLPLFLNGHRTPNNKPPYISPLEQEEFPAFPHMPGVCILKASTVLQRIIITMWRPKGMLIPQAGADKCHWFLKLDCLFLSGQIFFLTEDMSIQNKWTHNHNILCRGFKLGGKPHYFCLVLCYPKSFCPASHLT